MEENNMEQTTQCEDKITQEFHHWPIRISRVYYNQLSVDPALPSQMDERGDSKQDKKNITALYSKGSVAGWLYKFLEVIKQNFGFFPPMKLVQPSYEWAKCRDISDVSTKPSGRGDFESLELNLLYEKCSTICCDVRDEDRKKPINACNDTQQCNTCNHDMRNCEFFDNQTASLLLGETIDSLKAEKKRKKIEALLTESISDDNGNPKKAEVLYHADESGDDFPYIKYYCPRTFMLEFAFPLIVDETIIGVLIMGQLIPEDMKNTIFEKCSNLLNWEGDAKKAKEDEFFSPNQTYNLKSNEFNTLSSAKSDTFVLPSDGIDKFVDLFAKEAIRQSRCLQDRYNETWNSFKQNALSNFKKVFSEKATDEKKQPKDIEVLPTLLESIVEKLNGVERIYYYRATRKRDPKDTNLHFICGLKRNKENHEYIVVESLIDDHLKKLATNKIHGNLNNYPREGNTISIMLDKEGKDSKCIPYGLDNFRMNSHFFINLSPDDTPCQGFLVSFTDKFFKALQIRQVDHGRLQSLFDVIGEDVDFHFSFAEIEQAKNLYQSTSSFIAHEMTQQTFTISGRISDIETSWNRIYTASGKRDPILREAIMQTNPIVNNYLRDINSVYAQMTNLSKMLLAVSHRDDNLAIGYTTKWFRSEVVRPVIDSYYIKHSEKQMEIIPDEALNDQRITTLELPLTVIIFNLISNAIKYGFEGTKIYIKAAQSASEAQEFEFSVVDYGWEIKKEDKDWIFELGTRLQYKSDDNENSSKRIYQTANETGTGIGLNLVQEYLDSIQGKVTAVESVKVSDYNLPLILAAIASTRESPHKNKERLQAYYQEAESSGLYKEIVQTPLSFDRRKRRLAEIDLDVMKPMYKTTFTIKIPNKI
jgi:signal transduction histidine kinase